MAALRLRPARRLSRLLLGAVLAGCICAAGQGHAQEPPFLDNEEDYGRPMDGSALKVCIDPRDPAWEIDRDIAGAVAGLLLLEPEIYLVPDTRNTSVLDDVYAHLRGNCRAFFGFKLIAAFYPEWLTATRPYYQAHYVFVGRHPLPDRLGAIPPGTAVGATLGTAADFGFLQHNNLQPAERRWRRVPFGADDRALAAVRDGSVAAALVWGPSALPLVTGEGAAFGIVAPDPVRIAPMPVGALLLSSDTYLRQSIDRAIEALIAGGEIDAILAAHGTEGLISGF